MSEFQVINIKITNTFTRIKDTSISEGVWFNVPEIKIEIVTLKISITNL